jgi:hypothetical protein
MDNSSLEEFFRDTYSKYTTLITFCGMQPINDRHGCLFQFLDSLPVMESHYCRSTSQKKISSGWMAISAACLRILCQRLVQSKEIRAPFDSISQAFDGKNFALFRPKKDECEKYVSYWMGQVLEDEFNRHAQRKIEAADLQAVSKLYYTLKQSSKYIVFLQLTEFRCLLFCVEWVWRRPWWWGIFKYLDVFNRTEDITQLPADIDERSTITCTRR